MRYFCVRSARCLRAFVSLGLLLAAVSSAATSGLYAQDVLTIVRVEEDWSLFVSTPETSSNSPQITCTMSPSGGDDADYVTFELNHQSQPGYAEGGLHLHAWDGDFLLNSAHAQSAVYLSASQETINWTQSMSLSNGLLTYEVTQGTSATWGAFGAGELRVSVARNLGNLNGYSMDATIAGSGVGFGSNRVSSLVLKTVRMVTSTGEVLTFYPNHDVLAVSP